MEDKNIDKEELYSSSEELGISISKVNDEDKTHKRDTHALKVDFSLMSKKTFKYLKDLQTELRKEELRKRKNYFIAGQKETLMNKFVTSKSNLVMAMSGIALVVSAISLVNSSRGASKVFEDTEEKLTTTTVAQDNNTVTGSAMPEDLKNTLDEMEKKGPVIGTTNNTAVDNYQELENRIKEYVDIRLGEGSPAVGESGKSLFSFTTEEQKADFAHAVREAMDYLRIEDNRKNIERLEEKFSSVQNTTPNGRKIYGNPQARFIIQEYSDLECPYCKGFFETPKAVADASNGQVAVEWFHTPLSFHEPAATQEAVATECVFEQKGNKGFWVSLQYLFDTTYGNGKGSAALANLAESFNLDADKYLKCINSPESRQKIEKAKEIAAAAGVNSTPSSIIVDTKTGAQTVIGGAQDQSVLMEAIEKLNEQSASALNNVTPEKNS